MIRTRLTLPLAGVLALAACSSDRAEPVAPTAAPRPVAAATAATAGRYMVLSSSGAAFASDFASRVTALGGQVEFKHDGAGIAIVTGLTSTAADKLAVASGVSNVVQDVEFSVNTPVASVEADASDVGSGAGDVSGDSQLNPTTASRYAWQWNMRLIHAPAAWAAGKLGSAGVTAAILDTGIDYDAFDMNGLVDLSRSASFVPSDNALRATYFPTRHDITDFNGHGTNVATQVSSKAVALAGVTSKTTLIGVKVLNRSGNGNTSITIQGLLWAADHGADVANMSLGGGFAKAGNGDLLATIIRSLTYAQRKGMLVVVSAGNSAADLDHDGNFASTYCSLPAVVCVSAVGPAVPSAISTADESAPSFYTNFGRSAIDLAAPGGNARVDAAGNPIPSAGWPWGTDIASWVWSLCPKDRIAGLTSAGVPVLTVCAAGNRLSGSIGTSQAAPHVTGLAALLVERIGHGVPSQIKAALEQSSLDLGQVGTDPYYGKGRIDVARAMGL